DLAYLAAWSNLPDEHKRNLEALARAGTWYKNPPEQDDDSNYKRSIAYLAKNGQPPLMPLPLENQKRGIEALARNGDLLHRQTPQDLRTILEALYGKRKRSLSDPGSIQIQNTINDPSVAWLKQVIYPTLMASEVYKVWQGMEY
ncbi:uncharacterized protein LOC115881153, partial [Sitophilus oryzae]|uniref:Uncharacterized protein LOC115881153 n=1 Tax=Sitophilus oryzae TaxID=7048 RepID=A0A6J2XUC8_SITOR